MKLEDLYKKLFIAEENEKEKEVKRLKSKIRKMINEGKSEEEFGVCQFCGVERKWENDGEPCPECGHDHIVNEIEYKETKLEELNINEFKKEHLEHLEESDRKKIEFFYKTRKKSFHKNLREQIEKDEVDDIDLALAMTSMLTHSLIEMKKDSEKVYKELDVYTLTETVSKFLSGDLSSNEVMDILDEYYVPYLNTRVIKEDDEE